MGMFRVVLGVSLLAGTCFAAEVHDWQAYGGGDGTHYSSLAQINRDNVTNLVEAWRYDTGEKGGIEASPIIVGKVLYTTTPRKSVIALDAASGKLLWKYDFGLPGYVLTRGVSYWSDGKQGRILAGARYYLFALDATTGKLIPSFGENGRIDLRKGLREPYAEQSVSLTSPGSVYKDLIIVGGANPETLPAPPGDIRAYDVRTGALRWTFHTIPHPGEYGYETWPKDAWKHAGAANNWAGMTVDAARGIVYVPTGSAAFDFYGGNRVGNDLFADSLIALDAETGKRIWHFQGVHHDLWDRDFPAPPALVTVMHDGKRVDAVAQTTKSGLLYVFDRATGKSLFPIDEITVAMSSVPGEVASATQPYPQLPEPYTQQSTTMDTLTNRTPEAHAWAVKQLSSMVSGGQFVPPSVDKLTVDMPGFAGGGEWGGVATDPGGVLYVNANDTAWLVGLTIPPPAGSAGERVYQNQCSGCHGINRAGSPPAIPALWGIEGILTDQEIAATIRGGKGRMPPFASLSDDDVQAVVRYLTKAPQQQEPKKRSSDKVAAEAAGGKTTDDMPYKTIGFRRFTDP